MDTDSGCQRRLYILMSDLTACKAHLNMSIKNALYKFITITIICLSVCPSVCLSERLPVSLPSDFSVSLFLSFFLLSCVVYLAFCLWSVCRSLCMQGTYIAVHVDLLCNYHFLSLSFP